MEECGHKCSRPPLNVVSVSGCQDVKPKVIRAPEIGLESPSPLARKHRRGWKRGRTGRGPSHLGTGGPRQLCMSRDIFSALRMLLYADEPVVLVAVVLAD